MSTDEDRKTALRMIAATETDGVDLFIPNVSEAYQG
jgi:hypothetical protein